MICKKCGCDTLLEDGDWLVCAQCGAKYFDTRINPQSSITNQIETSENIPSDAPIENAPISPLIEHEETKTEEIVKEMPIEAEKKKSKLREIIEFLIPIIIALIISIIIKSCILANAVVPTGSMIPTINEKDRIIASRLAYKSDSPERYDVIMFSYPDNEDTTFVKRILGMPGETINVTGGKVYITRADGKTFAAEDSFVNTAEVPKGNFGPFYIPAKGEKITTDGSYCYAENGMNVGTTAFMSKYCTKQSNGDYTVSENLYFMIGDNINNSKDSRMWTNKYVAENKIIGKVVFKYYPKFEKFD